MQGKLDYQNQNIRKDTQNTSLPKEDYIYIYIYINKPRGRYFNVHDEEAIRSCKREAASPRISLRPDVLRNPTSHQPPPHARTPRAQQRQWR